MLRKIASAALMLVGFTAGAVEANLPPAVSSVEIKEVPYRYPLTQTVPNCGSNAGLSRADAGLTGLLDLGLGDIITIGNTLWNIVNAGKPVITLTTPEASAFPRGVTCWTDLDSWQPPAMHAYEVTYKNMFNSNAVKFGFALHYTYGGGKNGVGKYLANVTIMPTDLDVSWGYNFDATVEAEQAINIGSGENPVAGLEVNMKWTVKTWAKQSTSVFSYFVQGDGALINNSKAM